MHIFAFHTFNSAWNKFEDIVLWLLAVPVVWNLRVPLARKSVLFMLIAISFIAIIVSVVRMVVSVVWIRSADISLDYPLVPFLTNMEACVALMTSSVPRSTRSFESQHRRKIGPIQHHHPRKKLKKNGVVRTVRRVKVTLQWRQQQIATDRARGGAF